jgi:Spy/CpxP family protein refolding chaperone
MKKTLLITAFAVCSIFSFAQNNGATGKPPINKQTESRQKAGKLMDALDLTLDQKAQLKKLHTAQQVALTKFREQQQKDSKAAFEKILTPAQKTKLEQLKNLHKQSAENRANEKAQLMKITLGLNEDQFAKLQKQQKDMQGKLKLVKEDLNLTPEQKREKVKAIVKEGKDSLQQVLTAEQLKKFSNMRKEGAGFNRPPMHNEMNRPPAPNEMNRAPQQRNRWMQ